MEPKNDLQARLVYFKYFIQPCTCLLLQFTPSTTERAKTATLKQPLASGSRQINLNKIYLK